MVGEIKRISLVERRRGYGTLFIRAQRLRLSRFLSKTDLQRHYLYGLRPRNPQNNYRHFKLEHP